METHESSVDVRIGDGVVATVRQAHCDRCGMWFTSRPFIDEKDEERYLPSFLTIRWERNCKPCELDLDFE